MLGLGSEAASLMGEGAEMGEVGMGLLRTTSLSKARQKSSFSLVASGSPVSWLSGE